MAIKANQFLPFSLADRIPTRQSHACIDQPAEAKSGHHIAKKQTVMALTYSIAKGGR